MKQCPYCNAQIADDSKFCGECGKEYPQDNVCPKCGATVNEGDIYCEICGRNLKNGSYVSGDDGKSSIDYMKILLSGLIGIVIGIAILAIVGGSWYGYNTYTANKEKRLAREKFVADSLEQARQDSIRLAEQKEQERLEAEKLTEFRKKYTFENIFALLRKKEDSACAKRCGLSFIYKDFKDGGEDGLDCYEIVYGYDVEKGTKNEDVGYEIIPKSNHSCIYKFIKEYRSNYAQLYFKDSSDEEHFQEQAKNFGLLVIGDFMYVTKSKKTSGYHYVESLVGEDPLFVIEKTRTKDGWRVITIGCDYTGEIVTGDSLVVKNIFEMRNTVPNGRLVCCVSTKSLFH